jgi:hypothetical protein
MATRACPTATPSTTKKGRLRADGFKLVIVREEARVVQRIFRDFIDGKAINKIAKVMNDERMALASWRRTGVLETRAGASRHGGR